MELKGDSHGNLNCKSMSFLLISLLCFTLLIFNGEINTYGLQSMTNLISNPNKTKPTSNNTTTKVISFCIYGTNPCYIYGALENALIAKTLYNDWTLYYYIEEKLVSLNISKTLKQLSNVKLIVMNDSLSYRNSLWRFSPAFDDNNIDILIVRDTDSRLNIRDKLAVDEWLNSDKDFHIIRDHPRHNSKIMGGMWGVRNHLLLQLKSTFDTYYKHVNVTKSTKRDDQRFLNKCIYPFVVTHAFVHDDYKHHLEEHPHNISCSNYTWFIGKIVCHDFHNVNREYGLNIKTLTRKFTEDSHKRSLEHDKLIEYEQILGLSLK